MNFFEDQNVEYKSLKHAIGPKSNITALAETCVCFANAQGGLIIVGIEDGLTAPDPFQKVAVEDLNTVIARLRSMTDGVGIAGQEILQHDNGGEYFHFRILPSTRAIATTISGKVLIRITDKCYPVGSEELTNLAAEKNAFQWELVVPFKVSLADVDQNEVRAFVTDIKDSPKVSDFLKQLDVEDLLKFYQMLSSEGYLTNLGLIWLGMPQQRARVSYPITLQYIVYNERDEKIRKRDWHFHNYNPKSLLLDIEKEAVELTYSTELPDGLFRKQVRNYPKEVIRELLINAIAHKRFTVSGDIFIEVYTDRLVITNPGGLPLGINKNNILHERHRRNPHFIQTLHDLSLMEGEGSGYDLVYEKLGRDAKPLPDIESSLNKMSVTVYSGVVDTEVLTILDYVDRHFNLTQREYITLGLIARERKVLPTLLSQKLQLAQEDRLRGWIGSLLEKGIIETRGVKKGTQYLLNPNLFSQAKLDIKPSLKTIAPHQLDMLIHEDLKYNGASKLSEIHSRLNEVQEEDIRRRLYALVKLEALSISGGKRNRAYALAKKN
ncbi:ATP-dependent DNA helicase [Pedobacter quisquiliarum]|uniref:ATP-dependent DNA helicase n=1 Tax=Pedobacter quisquiliarum TaxID=1834438 RepID=A0A916U332_9SPHI|nr:ATP-binding protein [Pedobacter quisquiliarum]GGC57743.1 ATP-dependent DNA helicase [Pedobacter quisquiliarum]